MLSRESKSAATIRRRKKKLSHGEWRPRWFSRCKSMSDTSDMSDDEEEEEEFLITHPVSQLIFSSNTTLYLALAALRTINALMIQTAFVPDEYWQSLEVAYKMVYGYGYETWEWREGIRGYTYPVMFASLFKFLQMNRLDNRLLLIKLPRILQGLFAALGDLYLYKLSKRLSGHQVAQWTLLCQLTSWFTWYCCTRTLTNSMETVLTTIALYYYPWTSRHRKSEWKFVALVALAVVVRPTAAIMWLPLCGWHVLANMQQLSRVFRIYFCIGVGVLWASSTVDRIWSNVWHSAHYNFLKFNVLSNMGTFYGSHPWYWYVYQGFPFIMGTHTIPFILGAKSGKHPVFASLILWTIGVYSCLGHKEFRFIFPVLPLAMHICGSFIHSFCDRDKDPDADPAHHISKVPAQHSQQVQSRNSKARIIIGLLIAFNLPVAMYTSLLHQRGTVDVMYYIHDTGLEYDKMNTMFLMPCHSTPYYSYIHQNVSMRFLTCEPNLSGVANYTDEADVFYQNPERWLRKEYSTRSKLPSHLVMFNALEPSIAKWLRRNRYQTCSKFFHTHKPDGRVGSHVVVHCLGKKPLLKKPSRKSNKRATRRG